MKNGWHNIQGRIVLVEDGFIIRGIKPDRNGYHVTAYVYRSDKNTGWYKEDKITPNAFRSGVRRGTIDLF